MLLGVATFGGGCSALLDTSDLSGGAATSEPAIQASPKKGGAATNPSEAPTASQDTDTKCQRTPVVRAGPFWPHFAAIEAAGGAAWTQYTDLDDTGNTFTSSLNTNVALTSVLVLSDFQVVLPPDARVRGVIVEIERVGSGQIMDETVRLAHGSSRGDERASSAVWPPMTEVANYGNDTDLWGLAWTSASLGSDLSLRLQARRGDAALGTAVIDSALLWIAWDACR